MKNKGVATLIMVFIIGMACLVVALGLLAIGSSAAIISNNSFGSKKAFYAAQAGVEDILVRLQQDPNLGGASPSSTDQTILDEAYYVATISPYENGDRIATATGRYKNYFKRIEVKLSTGSAGVPFSHAVQTGLGGVEIGTGSEIKCLAPCTDGNVYSNGDIKGDNKNSSKINGNVWAHGLITKLSVAGNAGVWVTKNASASGLIDCKVDGLRYAISTPGANCTGGTFTQTATAPEIIPLPAFNEAYWKDHAENGGVFNGDCSVLSGGADDCTYGTGRLGPLKVNGTLYVSNNKTVTVEGPLWVTGNITYDNNVIIQLSTNFRNAGTVIVTDGKMSQSNNVVFATAGTGRILSVSTYVGDSSCSNDVAMTVSNNVVGLIAYAVNGCVLLLNNSTYTGAIAAEKLVLKNNTIVEYDPSLATAINGITSHGGWGIFSWKEVD